jgi:hypothetical protein
VAAVEGSFGTAKSAQRMGMLRAHLELLADFLDTLRPARRSPTSNPVNKRPRRAKASGR